MEVVFSRVAQRSLSNIANYIEAHFSRATSDRALHGIVSYAIALGRYPSVGKIVEEWSWRGEVRCAVYRQNQIYYLVRPNYVAVIVVWDSRQDPARLRVAIGRFFEEEF